MHEVVLAARAERDLKRLPAAVFRRVVGTVWSLAATPRPPGARKLHGRGRDDYRLRVGD